MITHLSLGETIYSRAKNLYELIASNKIIFAGNRGLKIYGLLNCKSGKKMKTENRVFFSSANEAEKKGYRPCGHCMKDAYNSWQHHNR